MESILVDLVGSPEYSVGWVIGETPLSESSFFVERERKEKFLERLLAAVRPLDQRPGYKGRKVIWIDGKSNEALTAEISACII